MDIEERAKPRTPVIYEVVRRLGEEEMSLPVISLWWSGVAAGLLCTFTPVLTSELRRGMLEISRQMMENDWNEMFFKGISAGYLMAAMVWLLPSADNAQFHMGTLITYLIAIGGCTHIVAGSVEAFLLLANGQLGVGTMFADFMLPVLLGNIVGGTALFALISYAQVMSEI